MSQRNALAKLSRAQTALARTTAGAALLATGTPVGVAAGALILSAEGARLVMHARHDALDAEQERDQLRTLLQHQRQAGAHALALLHHQNNQLEERLRILRDAVRAYNVPR